MKKLFSNFKGHRTHFSIYDKIKIRSKWRKMDRIHILSGTSRRKKLRTSIFYFSSKKDGWVGFKNRCVQWVISACLFVFVENNFFTFRTQAGRGFLTRRPPPPVLVTSLLFSDFVILQPPSTLFYFVSMTGHVIAAHILINFMMISL